MSWKQIHIRGSRKDYVHQLVKSLRRSSIDFIPGQDLLGDLGNNYSTIWVNEQENIRSVKLAVGARIIWKYRLRFYLSVELMLEDVTGKNLRETEDFRNHAIKHLVKTGLIKYYEPVNA